MSVCGGINQGSTYDCVDPIVGGNIQNLLLIDLEIWQRAVITYDVTIDNLITNIVLSETDDVGYLFEGIRKSLNPQSAFVPSEVSNGYDHQVDFLIFDVDQDSKNNIEKMAFGKQIAIIENTNAIGNGDSVFEVFGNGLGLEVQASAMRITGDADTNGAYTIALKTSDLSGKEQHLPNSFFAVDYAATKVIYDTLLIPVTP